MIQTIDYDQKLEMLRAIVKIIMKMEIYYRLEIIGQNRFINQLDQLVH